MIATDTKKCHCSLCGNIGKITTFRNGYVCEECISYVKSNNILKKL